MARKIIIEEDAYNADWLKVPDPVEFGLPLDTDMVVWLEEQGMQELPIYEKALARRADEEQKNKKQQKTIKPSNSF
jgi:hypothetical protein